MFQLLILQRYDKYLFSANIFVLISIIFCNYFKFISYYISIPISETPIVAGNSLILSVPRLRT
jgi:hypothetical protein